MSTHYAHPVLYVPKNRRWPDGKLIQSPVWCAVDLRDGNQALPNPMEPQQKLAYFNLLTSIGFKEIEVGFPAASLDDWLFCRKLIAEQLIPEEVTIAVLTQARPHIIQRTMEALRGVRKAICHVYLPASELHLHYVLNETEQEAVKRVCASIQQIRKAAEQLPNTDLRLEFSPEEFTDANLDFIVRLCDAVVEEWKTRGKVIINLPQTVERALPNHYADMIEAFMERTRCLDSMVISVHSHNDMGSAVASTELALLAGAQRVEGTLFGNGERSGNLDLVTLALNLQYLNIDTGLDFSRLMEVSARVAELTHLPVPVRQPYTGDLVFTAFSGSHQDAIGKGFNHNSEIEQHFGGWKLPYLHLNPADIGRQYENFIRINSQSGKGGIAYVLNEYYNIKLPPQMLEELALIVQNRTDETGRELQHAEIWSLFLDCFCVQNGRLCLLNYWPRPDAQNPQIIHAEVHLRFDGDNKILYATGDGPMAAFANAIRKLNIPVFKLLDYEERALGTTVNAESFTIVTMESQNGQTFYGVGFGANIVQGATKAIISALNRIAK